jgi:hypothetical protein
MNWKLSKQTSTLDPPKKSKIIVYMVLSLDSNLAQGYLITCLRYHLLDLPVIMNIT